MKKLMIKKWYNKMNVGYFEISDVPMDVDGVAMIKNVTEKAVCFYHNCGHIAKVWIPKSALFVANYEYATKEKNEYEVNYNEDEIKEKNNKENNLKVLAEVEEYLKKAYKFSIKDAQEDLVESKRIFG